MRTIVYLCRHGEVHNPNQVIYGRLSGFPLSKRGEEEAHRLGKHLSSKKLAAIYASPLTRTRQTAAIVASYHGLSDILADERLLEVNSPALEGKLIRLFEDQEWNFYAHEYIDKGGERLRDIWKRINHFLQEAVKKHKGQEIAVFSHGDPIMIARAKYRGRRLSFSMIREKPYVGTARGIKLEFEEDVIVDVSDLPI